MNISPLVNENGYAVRNQMIIKTDKATYFQSYKSVICKLDGTNIILSQHWDYSNTTRKHLYAFLRQQGYHTMTSKKSIKEYIAKGVITLADVPSINII